MKLRINGNLLNNCYFGYTSVRGASVTASNGKVVNNSTLDVDLELDISAINGLYYPTFQINTGINGWITKWVLE